MPKQIKIFKICFALNFILFPVFCFCCLFGCNIFAQNITFWLLGSFLILSNCLLFIGKSLNNVFLPILGINTLVFFLFGLCYMPLRDEPSSFYAAERISPFQPESYFQAMLLVTLSNLICFVFNFKFRKNTQSIVNVEGKIKPTCFFILFLIIFTVFTIFSQSFSNQYIPYLNFVYSTLPIHVFYFTFLFFPKNKNRKILKKLCFALLFSCFIYGVMQGRRSDLFVISMSFILSLIASGTYTIKKNTVILLLSILFLSVFSFSFITDLRTTKKEYQGSYSSGNIFQYKSNNLAKKKFKEIVEPVFERISSLDLLADCIKNKLSYLEIVNLNYYFKSIADNLVPGIWFYDVPRASNALRTVYANFLLKRQMDSYHSDMLTAYGELFIFSNFIITPIIFYCIFFIFSLFYYNLDQSRQGNQMLKLFILFLFVSNLNSYGADWTVISAVQASFWIVLATLLVC